jgi:hypothetical protein
MKPEKVSAEIRWPRRIITPADAVRYLDAVGYCLLFPIKALALPSLYYAMARRQFITWDRHAVKLWDWKAQLPLKRRAFYAKYFKGRGTFISLRMLPQFLAMRESAASADDAEKFFAAGTISREARTIWEALARLGPLPTLELRHACEMESVAGNKRFKKAMLELQTRLLVVHSGAEQETASWPSGRFDLTSRAFPRETALAGKIAPNAARVAIAGKYLKWHPPAAPRLLARIFGWSKEEAVAACHGNTTS